MGRPKLYTAEQRIERQRARARRDYLRNKERILQRTRERYAADPKAWGVRGMARAKLVKLMTPDALKAERLAKSLAALERSNAAAIAYAKAHPEQGRASRKKYHAAHPEVAREKRARYVKRHPEKVRAERKARDAKKRSKLSAQLKKWHAANPGKQRQYYATRKRTHPHEGTLRQSKRRAIKAKASVGDLAVIAAWVRSWRSKPTATCYYCLGRFPSRLGHVEHIVPLAKGGEHLAANLAISCKSCNSAKNAKPLEQWNARLAQPVLF